MSEVTLYLEGYEFEDQSPRAAHNLVSGFGLSEREREREREIKRERKEREICTDTRQMHLSCPLCRQPTYLRQP